MDFKQRIVHDKNVCSGSPFFKGTRVPLRTVLASLADGDSVDALLKDFPSLTAEHIRAANAFAASSAEEDLPTSDPPDGL